MARAMLLCADVEQDVETLNTRNIAGWRAGLVEQIARDMQTLSQLDKLGYVAHPGQNFYLDRIDTYRETLAQLDAEIQGPGDVE